MAPQTSYSINTPAWSYPGQIADLGLKDVVSAIATAAAFPYGLLGIIDTANSAAGYAELSAKLPSAVTDFTTNVLKQLGVCLADQARAQDPSVAAAVYPIGSAVPFLRKGRVVVQAETAVTAGTKVYGRFATGDNGTQPGAFGGILDTSVVGNALLANAVWVDTTSAAGFAVLEINLT